jgi:Mn2+/Fe2+ NRAMP family transporter
MTLSNGIMFFIVLTAGATLYRAGLHDVQTAEQAARALRPIAGPAAALLFTTGIVATGMLGVPVLAGSAAYAVAEAAGWEGSLSLRLEKGEGRAFYAVLATSMLGGVILCFTPTSAVQELFWSAVLNGVVAVPIMIVMMLLASRADAMAGHPVGPRLRVLGWAATAVMACAVVAMVATAV